MTKLWYPGRPPLIVVYPEYDLEAQRAFNEERRQQYREQLAAWRKQEAENDD